MAITYRALPADELINAPNRDELFDEYARESSIKGMPPHRIDVTTYKALETNGALCAFGAFDGDVIVGFVAVFTSVFPHYSAKVSMTESFFVKAEYRRTGAGLKLLRIAERHAKDVGSVGLLLSAPFEGNLIGILPRKGYAETNRVFFKKLSDE